MKSPSSSSVAPSRVDIPITPLPPRRCARNALTAVRLMNPPWVMLMMHPSFRIKSSMAISPSSGTNWVSRGLAYLSRISRSSFLIMVKTRCSFAIGRSANNANELIQVRQGNQITFQRFRPLFRLAQFKPGAAKNDFASVLDVRLVSNFEWQQFWPAVIDRQHVHGEGRFHRGVLVEIVNYDFRI